MTPEVRVAQFPGSMVPLERVAYLALWLLGAGFLLCAPCAQLCAGMSRFVLLAGLSGLFLAWPKSSGMGFTWRSLLGLLPLLGLALALDLQAGLEVRRAASLAGHGALLCLTCAVLGACRSRGRGALQGLIFGLWFLLPLALGLWSHVAGSVTLDPHRILSWSPVASFWQGLALSEESAPGLALQRNGSLVGTALIWFAWGQGRGVAKNSDGGQD